jgi:hypothetical protein
LLRISKKRCWPNEICRLANVLKMSNIGHFPAVERCIMSVVKTRDLTREQIVSVPCPTCGAAAKEPCELNTGAPRTEAHRDRKLCAADAVEARSSRC